MALGTGGLTITPDGSRVFVVNEKLDSISVVDTNQNAIIATISVASPVALDAHPDGRSVYVAGADGVLTVIDTVTNTVRDRYQVGDTTEGVSLSADGRFAYVSGATDPDNEPLELFQVDTSTGQVAGVISEHDAEQSMGSLAFTKDGRLGIKSGQDLTNPLILDIENRAFSYVDCDCRIARCEEGVSNAPGSATVWDATNRAYVGGWGGYAVDLSTRRVVGQISRKDLQGLPIGVAVGPCPEALNESTRSTASGCAIAPRTDDRLWLYQLGVLLTFLCVRGFKRFGVALRGTKGRAGRVGSRHSCARALTHVRCERMPNKNAAPEVRYRNRNRG
jgi:YVTN family beta-propeller protein